MRPKDQYDCLVIGAGPAGGTAACLISDAGYETALIERESMPRFHVGESLMPEIYWSIQRLGLLDKMKSGMFTKKNGVQFVNDKGKESRPFFFAEHDSRECSKTWHVQRAEFDNLLFEKASENGADCIDQMRATNIAFAEPNSDGLHCVTVKGKDGSTFDIKSKLVIDASGQSSLISNRLGLRMVNPELKKAAIWGYYENAKRNSSMPGGGCQNGACNVGPCKDGAGRACEVTCILHTKSKACWFWYIPLSDGSVSVGLVGDNDDLLKRLGTKEEIFAEEMQNCPALLSRLEGAKQTGKINAAKEFSYTSKECAGDGWILAGDAYGFIDPVYSSGVFLALKSGEMAADAAIEGFKNNNLSSEMLGRWKEEYDDAVKWMRKLVMAFYTKEFSFGEFMKYYPQHAGNLTDLLIGRVFDGEPGKIFEDMDPWIEALRMGKDPAEGMVPSTAM